MQRARLGHHCGWSGLQRPARGAAPLACPQTGPAGENRRCAGRARRARVRVLTPRAHCSARLMKKAPPDAGSCPGHVGVWKKREGRAGQNAQFAGTGQRADSVHLVEKLCSFYHLDIHRHPRERAGMGECGGSAVGARYIVRGREDATQNVFNIKRAQGCCPWSPPQEGARGQSSSARRGLPSKGEARALHHQPAPA